ncbi:MAG: 2-oxo acid dehydrogenase subunit E2 [Treponema sp.]|jgi:hypothetical protein|nr:2-oxo acid dehydrogenase subunit E2 [Treponema sp.]
MFTKKRPDGTYIGGLHFFTQLLPYLMPKRSDACIYFEQEIDVTGTIEYLRKRKHDESGVKITFFYIILYAAVRVLALRPKLNRFVSGYRYYQRNKISFNFVAKRSMTDEGEEVNVTLSFSPLLSLEEFCKKIHGSISVVKEGKSTDSEKVNSIISGLPRPIIRFLMWGVGFLDYHNALPKSVIESLPFYTSVFFTYVGSVGIDAPFHHNFEIGNCGLFIAIGKLRKENCLKKDGTVQTRDRIKMTFTYDDRIADGIYCARAIDMVRDFVENPQKLETPLELTEEQLKELNLAAEELKIS